ncbi:MAG: lipid-A-disaccharide synthase [Prevotella sp.]|nr:lipid-A-disaccharide synthase [Prevotella sp.]MDD5784718.1 lipid-A-disaccharide synthase [Prevotella sp.]
MKYYLIVGEASGDLHASCLMHSLKEKDHDAEFRFFGGDLMAAEGGTIVRHYRELAYMGFIPVLLHLPTILKNMKMCKRDIVEWRPDVVILVDYPGFNLKIAKFLKQKTSIPVFYYISPKIWAWKEYRIKNIKRDVDQLFSILPFEVPFFEVKHHYPIHYVGNPTADEVRRFKASYDGRFPTFSKPVIAILAGSRLHEIKDNLPVMLRATDHLADRFQLVVAGAPSVPHDYYLQFFGNRKVEIVYDQTYPLLMNAHAALVTSGTATLETALFDVPQVVCYATPLPRLISVLRRILLKVKYVSLVNLIADSEVVKELVAADYSEENVRREIDAIIADGPQRNAMKEGYADVWRRLGKESAPDNAARQIVKLLESSSLA